MQVVIFILVNLTNPVSSVNAVPELRSVAFI